MQICCLNHLKKVVLGSVLMAGLIYCLIPLSVLAQSPLEISVSPPTAYLAIKPGSSVKHTITLQNKGDNDLKVTPKVVGFKPDGVSGKPVLGETHSFPYFQNESSLFQSVVLPKEKTAQLTLLINVPKNAEPKEYPLTILFSAEHPSTLTNNPTALGVIGSNLIITITGEKEPFAVNIREGSLPKLVDSFQTLKLNPLAQNQSSQATQVAGSATITNWQGKEVTRFSLYPDVVLAGSTRLLRAVADSQSQDKSQIISNPTEIEYDPGFLIGPYRITITLKPFSEETQPATLTNQVSYSAVFFAFPFGLSAIILAALSVLLLYRSLVRHNAREEKPI